MSTLTLLGLAPELRNQIFLDVVLTRRYEWQYGEESQAVSFSTSWIFRAIPPIMQVCAQLRHEAAPMFIHSLNIHLEELNSYIYGPGRFRFDYYDYTARLLEWLHFVTPAAMMNIRSLPFFVNYGRQLIRMEKMHEEDGDEPYYITLNFADKSATVLSTTLFRSGRGNLFSHRDHPPVTDESRDGVEMKQDLDEVLGEIGRSELSATSPTAIMKGLEAALGSMAMVEYPLQRWYELTGQHEEDC